MALDLPFSIGDATEWETEIVPHELSSEYGRKWPLSAAATFRIALWLTRTERYRLADRGKRLRPRVPVVSCGDDCVAVDDYYDYLHA